MSETSIQKKKLLSRKTRKVIAKGIGSKLKETRGFYLQHELEKYKDIKVIYDVPCLKNGEISPNN